jgi:multiple sugar transport system permease protein
MSSAREFESGTVGPVPARWRHRFRPAHIVLSAILLVVALIMVAPLVWLVSTSLTAPEAAFTLPPKWIPRPFSLENFQAVDDVLPFGRMALNSVIVSVIVVCGSLFTSVLAAFAFSRLSFPGRSPLFMVLLSALMVPGQLTVIPVFVLMRHIGLIDNLAAIWLPALVNVFAIFFLRQYFNTIPRELDDAARIDGAGNVRILFQVIVPLSGPALSALAILGFEASWNNYFGPLIFLTSPEKMTLPVGLVSLQSNVGGATPGVIFAAITLVVVPMLVLFVAFQRTFVESIASVGIRG